MVGSPARLRPVATGAAGAARRTRAYTCPAVRLFITFFAASPLPSRNSIDRYTPSRPESLPAPKISSTTSSLGHARCWPCFVSSVPSYSHTITVGIADSAAKPTVKRMPTVKVSTHDGYKGIYFFRIPTLGQARGARPCLQQRRGTVHVLRYPSLCIFGKKYMANTVANTYSWVGVGLSNTSLGQLLAS